MGRNKLKIEKLMTNGGRQVTYSKRKSGIMKKAKELSVLCDVDVLLLVFSTTGKASISVGENSFEEIIEKYANLSPQERYKRKLESLEALKKTFKKVDHEVDVDQLLDQGSPRVEDLEKQVDTFKKQINDTYGWLGSLGCLTELEKVDNMELVLEMERTLKSMITQNRIQMNGLNQQLDQNGEQLLLNLNDRQQMPPPHNSILNQSSLDDIVLDQHAILAAQKGPPPQKDIGRVFAKCFTGITAPTNEIHDYLNQFPAHQEQTIKYDNLLQPREMQYMVPQTNAYKNPGDFLSLPEGCISDNEFVNNLLEHNVITFDFGVQDRNLPLNTDLNSDANLNPNLDMNLNPSAYPNLVMSDLNFNAWACGI